jgi:hypothetical protein
LEKTPWNVLSFSVVRFGGFVSIMADIGKVDGRIGKQLGLGRPK